MIMKGDENYGFSSPFFFEPENPFHLLKMLQLAENIFLEKW